MKRALLCLSLTATLAFGIEVPELTRPVTDLAGVLSPEKVESLSQQLEAHWKASGVQLAVLTLDTTDGEAIESFSLRTAKRWGGGDQRRNDGGLFVLAMSDRAMRIELGYGLEGRVTDAEARWLLEQAKPFLRKGDPEAAVQRVMDGLIGLTKEGTMSLSERARLDAERQAARDAERAAELRAFYAYVVTLLAFGIIGRIAKARLDAKAPPSKKRVAIVLGVLIVAVELGCGVLGYGWATGVAALCGSLAGLTFLFSVGALTLMYPLFLVFTPVAGLMVSEAWRMPALALAQLLVTFFFAMLGDGWSLSSSSTTFDSSGASSDGGSSRREADELELDSSPSWGTRRSSSASSWDEPSPPRSSPSGHDSGSSRGSYSGGGGSFGGGGASSSW